MTKKTKIVSLVVGIALIVSIAVGVMLTLGAETTATARIGQKNVIYNEKMCFAVEITDVCELDESTETLGLIYWGENVNLPISELTVENATCVDFERKLDERAGVYYYVTSGIPAASVFDEVHFAACVKDNETKKISVISEIISYSVAEYAGARIIAENVSMQQTMLYQEILDYGLAAMKVLDGGEYSSSLALIKTEGGGTVGKNDYATWGGAYGEPVSITAPEVNDVGQSFYGWEYNGYIVSKENSLTVALGRTGIYTYTAVYGSTEIPDAGEGDELYPTDVKAEKTASVGSGVTLYPTEYIAWSDTTLRGSQVTYTITATNTGESAVTTKVRDSLPANTVLVSGCDDVNGDRLTWWLELDAGETKSVSYTVCVNVNEAYTDGGYIEGGDAFVNGLLADCYDLYIENTLNEVDQDYIERAIMILTKSTYTDLTFAKFAYTIAFSNAAAITDLISGTPDEVIDKIFSGDELLVDTIAPGLYGGTAASEIAGAKGMINGDIEENDFISGDLLFVSAGGTASMYIVCGDGMYDITATAEKQDTAELLTTLDEADKYAVIRPSVAMTSFTPSDPDETTVEMTDYQEAIVKTAETYLLRGESLQYEDTYFGLHKTSGEYRWAYGQKAPEEYTTDEWGYTNCAAFTYDVYLNSLGYSLPDSMYTTGNLASKSDALGMRAFYFKNETPGEYTDEYKLEIERQFMETAEAGDIIVVRRSDSTGHAMLYVGNGRFIHSSGSVYKKNSSGVGYENYEPTVRHQKVIDYLFNPNSSSGNPFGSSDDNTSSYVTELLLVRPLNVFDGEIPENTVARIENMQGIRAEKRASHVSSISVNQGDNITFTFSLFNVGAESKTVEIFDKVPEGTTYVSGGESVSGDELRWTVTVGAGETVEVSYVVRVNDDTAEGFLIDGNDATVGGVMHRCAAIRVKNTLTSEQQQALLKAIDELREEGATGGKLVFVNAIYERAFGISSIFDDTVIDNVVREGSEAIFATSSKYNGTGKYLSKLRTDETYYSSMLVDHLYGGIRFDSADKMYDRTRLLKTQNMIIGDVIIARASSAEYIFMYIGNDQYIELGSSKIGSPIDFGTCGERLLYYGRDFAVLRPSYVFE